MIESIKYTEEVSILLANSNDIIFLVFSKEQKLLGLRLFIVTFVASLAFYRKSFLGLLTEYLYVS